MNIFRFKPKSLKSISNLS